MKICLIYFLLAAFILFNVTEGMEKCVLNNTKSKINEESSHNLIANTLTNIYIKAEKNLKLPDECMVCYEYFPVSFQLSCGHELCSLCAESIMDICDNRNCPKCRAPFPHMLLELLNIINIYPIHLTPDIPIKKLQRTFPLICMIANLTIVTKCIDMGVDVNTKGFCGYFPIQLASKKENVVKYLVDKGANVHRPSGDGMTPLLWNCEMGNLLAVQYLIQKGVDVNQAKLDGTTPLVMSCGYGHLSIVEYLVKNGANMHQLKNDGVTTLYVSSQNGHLPVVQYLVENTVDVNLGRNDGITPLIMSSQTGHLPVVQYLIENGGNVNQADNEGRTPLYVSSLNGHLKVVKYLIYKGADINQTTAHGITPLACAIHNNEIEVAKFLLRNNANIENTKLGLKKYGKLELIEILDILYKEMEKE